MENLTKPRVGRPQYMPPADEPRTTTCNVCNELLPQSAFATRKKKEDGTKQYRRICRICYANKYRHIVARAVKKFNETHIDPNKRPRGRPRKVVEVATI